MLEKSTNIKNEIQTDTNQELQTQKPLQENRLRQPIETANASQTKHQSKQSLLDLFDDEEEEIVTQKQTNQRKLSGMWDDVEGNMPMSLKEKKGIVVNKTPEQEMEEEIRVLAEDTHYGPRYKKVRKAAEIYRHATNEAQKQRALTGLRDAIANYLMERKNGSSQQRLQRCLQMVDRIDQYCDDHKISTEHDIGYLLTEDNIRDEELDAEIRLAYRQVRSGKEATPKHMGDRRKAFRRKIVDVKKAHQLNEATLKAEEEMENALFATEEKYGLKEKFTDEEYESVLKETLTSYAVSYSKKPEEMSLMYRLMKISDEASNEQQQTKANQISKVLNDILTWDISSFAYRDASDFAGMPKATFIKKYQQLKVAKNAGALLDELYRLNDEFEVNIPFDDDVIKEMRSRIDLLSEVENDYRERLHMMSSPYYALLYGADSDDAYDFASILNASMPKTVYSADFRSIVKRPSPQYHGYVSALAAKKLRFDPDRVKGGEYTRHRDLAELLRWHHNRNGASKEFSAASYQNTGIEITNTSEKDLADLRESDAQKEVLAERQKELEALASNAQKKGEKFAEEWDKKAEAKARKWIEETLFAEREKAYLDLVSSAHKKGEKYAKDRDKIDEAATTQKINTILADQTRQKIDEMSASFAALQKEGAKKEDSIALRKDLMKMMSYLSGLDPDKYFDVPTVDGNAVSDVTKGVQADRGS